MCACHVHGTKLLCHNTEYLTSLQARLVAVVFQNWAECAQERRCKYIHNFGTDKRTEGPVGDLSRTCQGYDLMKMCKLPDTAFKMAVLMLTTATDLSNNLRRLTYSLPQAYQQELLCSPQHNCSPPTFAPYPIHPSTLLCLKFQKLSTKANKIKMCLDAGNTSSHLQLHCIHCLNKPHTLKPRLFGRKYKGLE